MIVFPFTPYTLPKFRCLHRTSNFTLMIFFFIFQSLKNSSLIVDKHAILLILVNSRVETFSFCTNSLDWLLLFFPYQILSFFFRMLCFLSSLSVCFFLILLFSSKMCTKSKSRISSFNYPSNHLFHQSSLFVFGNLLALTNSEKHAAAVYIVLLSSVRFRTSIVLSNQSTLFIAHFMFALEIHIMVLIAPFFLYKNNELFKCLYIRKKRSN